MMKGADMWDMVVRHEISLVLRVGCGPDASSSPLVCGTSGVGDMGLWRESQGEGLRRQEWKECEATVLAERERIKAAISSQTTA